MKPGLSSCRPGDTFTPLMAYFLHYTAHSSFPEGIFVPFGTQVEAERQAACDLGNGVDPEFIERIFEAPYELPKFGWLRSEAESASLLPHLMDSERTVVASRKQILGVAAEHQEFLLNESVKAQAEFLIAEHRALLDGSAYKMAVPGNAYSVMTGGTATAAPQALSAATARTLVMITSSTANQPSIVEVGISFDGVTASAVPVLVELVSGTATSTGTVVSQTPKQLRGWPAQAAQTTGQITVSVEPTTQLVNRKWYVSPNGGLFVMQFPMGREPTGIVTASTDAKTWSIRATAPATVNAHAYLEFEE